jgi:integrase/recombinase XerD
MSLLRDNMIRLMELRNFSEKTIKSYVWAVRGLAAHYRRSPDQLSAQEVQDYLFHLIKDRQLSWNTVHLAVYGIKFFFHQYLGKPANRFYVPSPKTPKRLPVIWTPQEIGQLFDAAPNRKIRTMLKTCYGAGLRSSEVTHLKVSDIDSGHMTLWVRQGKGKKDRAGLLTPSLLDELRRYWREYRPAEWLFPRDKGTLYMRPESFGAHFRAIRDKVNKNKACGAHSLRHSFATHMVASGADIFTVQRLLGHKSISTSMIYIHLAQSVVLSKARNLDLLKLKSLTC